VGAEPTSMFWVTYFEPFVHEYIIPLMLEGIGNQSLLAPRGASFCYDTAVVIAKPVA
jgi:hypothetical protein